MHVLDGVPPDETVPLCLHVLGQLPAGAVSADDARAEAPDKLFVNGRLDALPRGAEGEDGAGVQGPEMRGKLGREKPPAQAQQLVAG